MKRVHGDEIRKEEVELISEKLRPGSGEWGGWDGPVQHCFISILSYIIYLFGSCDRDALEKVFSPSMKPTLTR